MAQDKIRIYGVTSVYSGTDGMVNGSLMPGLYTSYENAFDACRSELEDLDEAVVIIDSTNEECDIFHTFDPETKEWTEDNRPKMDFEDLRDYADDYSTLYLYAVTPD